MKSLFNSRYPIISAPMNQVSNLDLALAVKDAGGFPSISGYCYKDYYQSEKTDIQKLVCDLEEFVSKTRSSDLILAIDDTDIINPYVVSCIKRLKISHVLRYKNENEKFSEEKKDNFEKLAKQQLKKIDCFRIEMKLSMTPLDDLENIYFVKGNEGAGRPGCASTKDMFLYFKSQYHDAKLVPVGGIGSKQQIDFYLEQGAVAVALGSVFAAAKESILSNEVKKTIVSSEKTDIQKFDDVRKQNSLIFKKNVDNDDSNNTQSLIKGIQSKGNDGHIFLGYSVAFIDDILTVKEIIDRLVK